MKKTKKLFLFLMVTFLAAAVFLPAFSYSEDVADSDISIGVEAVENQTVSEKNIPGGDQKRHEMSLLDLIDKGGVVGYLIILLSIVSVGLIIEYSFTIRKSRMLPAKDIDALRKLIKNREFGEIDKLDKDNASFLSKVAIAGIRESHLGYKSMIKAMEDAGEALASRIARKTEHLNVIGNISPMMGLLGTVIGMLRCFNEISHMAGAIEPKQLAGGIFEALVTTCMGLIVAIPALYCYAVFRNRVDEYTGEASLMAEQLVSSFKTDQNG